MITNPTTGAGASTTGAAGSVGPRTDGLGRDAFLQMLVTQLRHQDPTAPQDSAQMLTQLATFSSLEKLTNIETSINAIGDLVLNGQALTTNQGGQD